MYGNMTREEMITRLYEGNFTTGELERQLIAKLFEQCCGGGSSSGETLKMLPAAYDQENDIVTINETAVEIFEALKTMPVIYVQNYVEGSDNILSQGHIIRVTKEESGRYVIETSSGTTLYAANDNDYPTDQQPGSGGEVPIA